MKGAFDEAQKKLAEAREAVIREKENCKRKMTLKCDNCKKLKCAQAERNCKGFLDAAGKWIGGVVNAAGESKLICVIIIVFFVSLLTVCKMKPFVKCCGLNLT